MKDFTLKIYEAMILSAKSKGYQFQTFEDFISKPLDGKLMVLRHDVDRIPINALKMAQIEAKAGVKASYFFRIVSSVWDEEIISAVADLGHEVAYHYEDMTICNGDFEKAIVHFEKHLAALRRFYPSKTICMHGSPMSKWDNRKIWEKYNYRDYGIIAEPYFDVDYGKTFYITDTGRSWDNSEFNVRDRVDSKFDITIKSTEHIISKFEDGSMPQIVMINTHPHRWFDPSFGWYRELIMQNLKNTVKRLIVKNQ